MLWLPRVRAKAHTRVEARQLKITLTADSHSALVQLPEMRWSSARDRILVLLLLVKTFEAHRIGMAGSNSSFTPAHPSHFILAAVGRAGLEVIRFLRGGVCC